VVSAVELRLRDDTLKSTTSSGLQLQLFRRRSFGSSENTVHLVTIYQCGDDPDGISSGVKEAV
jgi:hypothetical protein